jgi:hypothetical protein
MDTPMTTFQEKKKHLIARSAWLILFIFAINYMAMKFFWYSMVWWFDMPMHFLGGFWLGLTALWVYLFYRASPGMVSARKMLIVGLCAVLIIGMGWEVFEIGIDRFITYSVFNPLDTASDLFFDLAGGATAILYLLRRGYAD